jgi:hypothetical protein
MWSSEELERWKQSELDAAERAERYENNGGATGKKRKKHPSNKIPKKQRRRK